MDGSSIAQSNTPHPSREEQAASGAQSAAQASIMKIQCKGLSRPLRMKKYYGRKKDDWQCIALTQNFGVSFLTQMKQFYIFEVQN
jgi:hypothetical protein